MSRTKQQKPKRPPRRHEKVKPQVAAQVAALTPGHDLPSPKWNGNLKRRAFDALEKLVQRTCHQVGSVADLREAVTADAVAHVQRALGQLASSKFHGEIVELCDTFMLQEEYKAMYFAKLRERHAPMCESDAQALSALEDQEFAQLCDADPAFEPAWRSMQNESFLREIKLIEAERAARLAAKKQEWFDASQRYYEKRHRQDPGWARKNPELAQTYLGFAPVPDFYEERHEVHIDDDDMVTSC